MAVNKVVINDEIKIDLTSDTVSPDTLSKGITAHDKSGNVIVGTMEGGGAPSGQWREETVDNENGQITKVVYHGYTVVPSYQYSRKRLTSIKFNEGVTTINSWFDGTNAGGYNVLNELVLPSTLTEIKDYFMYDSDNNINIDQNNAYAVMTVKPTLPSNLKKIGKYCFNLTIPAASGSWELPDSIEELGNKAFYIPRSKSDNSFTLNVKFGSGLTTLRGAPFYTYLGGMSKYKRFVYDFRKSVSIPTLTTASLIGLRGKTYDSSTSNVYTEETDVLTIIVPDELYDQWKVATNWVQYSSCFKKASEVTE